MKIPTQVPKPGFYYHYKHNPSGPVNNYAYEFVAVGVHTEDDCRPEDQNLCIYRPLYESSVFKAGKLYDVRPLEMWMGNVEIDGKTVSRFSRIGNPEIQYELRKISFKMYGR